LTIRASILAAALLGGSLVASPGHADGDAPPLWQLDGKSNSIYLLGSIHVLRNGSEPLAASILRAYDDADVVYMEIDFDDLDPAEMQQFTLTNGVLPPDQSLPALLGEERYAQAKTAAAKLGLDLDQLAQLEPWVVAISAVQAQVLRLGLDPDAGIERRLARDAQRDQKEIRGLETIADQLGIFDRLPLERQQDFLLMSLEEAIELPASVDDMISAWKRGDVKQLTEAMSEDFKSFPELYEPLVVARNRNWTRQIIELLDDESDYLVVVGALHLAGDDSVIEMLREQGHPAKRR
jgi:uncharacterized protein YbaP (TraB family)